MLLYRNIFLNRFALTTRQGRILYKCRVCHRWFLEGRRGTAICDRRYDWAYIFSTVRPATGADFTLVLPEVSARAMNLFLGTFAETLACMTEDNLILRLIT